MLVTKSNEKICNIENIFWHLISIILDELFKGYCIDPSFKIAIAGDGDDRELPNRRCKKDAFIPDDDGSIIIQSVGSVSDPSPGVNVKKLFSSVIYESS